MSIYQPVNWTTVAVLTSAWLAAQLLLWRARQPSPPGVVAGSSRSSVR